MAAKLRKFLTMGQPKHYHLRLK